MRSASIKQRHKALAALLALSLSNASSHAQDGMMREADILRDVIGSTMSGNFTDGRPWSEFHMKDGRVLGHSGASPNRDACWTLKGGRLCYYYGKANRRRAVCTTMERKGKNVTVRWADSGELIGIAEIQPGNPRSHSDEGAPWSCDALISARDASRQVADLR
jgi:hypothetical protein